MSAELAAPQTQIARQEQPDRASYIGSADIAAICGLSPWQSAYDVWEKKRGYFLDVPDEQRDKRLQRGKRFEPLIIDMYQEETGAWITGRNLRYIDAEYEFLSCEIDAEETDEQTDVVTNLEAKSVSAHAAYNFGDTGTDRFPAYYRLQTLFGLDVSTREHSKVLALVGTDDLRVYEAPRHEEVIAWMREKAITFWQKNVLGDLPPAIQTSRDAERMIAKYDGAVVLATDETRKALRTLKGIKAAQKRLEEAAEREAMRVKTHMALHAQEGDPNQFALVDSNGNRLATWDVQQRKGYTVEPTSFRVFRTLKVV